MENTVIQEMSHGSPMLAYGTAGSPLKRRVTLILIVTLAVVIIPIMTVIGIFFFGSVELPKDTLLAISVTPSAIEKKLNGALIAELPSAWRSAMETNSSLPVILGLAKTTSNGIAPYAIIPRTASVSAPERTRLITGSLTRLILTESLETESGSYRSFFKLLKTQKHADAGFQLSERILLMITGQPLTDARDEIPVYGSITGNRGTIFLPIDDFNSKQLTGELFAIIGDSNIGAEGISISDSLLTQGIDVRGVHAPESLMMNGRGEVTLSWSNLGEEERSSILVASGKTTGTTFQLPDGVIATLIAPDATSTPTVIVTQGRPSETSTSTPFETTSSNCPGDIRFSIRAEPLQKLLIMLQTPRSWRERIESFTISSNEGTNIFCLNE